MTSRDDLILAGLAALAMICATAATIEGIKATAKVRIHDIKE